MTATSPYVNARRLLLAVAVSATFLVASPGIAHAGSCYRDGRTHYDPIHKVSLGGWYCGNRGGALVQLGPDYWHFSVARMQTTWSWFLCWKRGSFHGGGNYIWYWTRGDVAMPGRELYNRWGFVPAVDVWTSRDPWPSMPECSWNPWAPY
jgi:hypothetical protein